MVRRVVEEGWSLTEAAEAAGVSERTARSGSTATGPRERPASGPLLGAAVGPPPHPRGAGRGDRRAAAAADDRGRDRRVPRDGALHRLGDARPDRARQALAGWSRPSRPTATSASSPGELIHIDVKKLGRIARGAGHRMTGKRPGQRSQGRRLGVRPRLRRRRHPPGLRRGPGRREGDDGDRLPEPRHRLLRRPRDHRRAADDRQRLRPTARPRTRSPAGPSGSATSAPAPTGRAPTARPSASSAPCSGAGPTGRSTATRPSEPRRYPAGSSSITGADHMAPSARGRPALASPS